MTAVAGGDVAEPRLGLDEARELLLNAMLRTGRRCMSDTALLAEGWRVFERLHGDFMAEGADGDPAGANALAWQAIRRPRIVKAVRRELRRELAAKALRRGKAISSAEEEAHELNHCSDSMGAIAYWKADGGQVVRDVDAEEQERAISRAWRRLDEQKVWRHAVSFRRLRGFVRPLVRVHERGRARRGSRATLRRAPARSPGRPADDDPDPLAALAEAAA